MSKASDRRNAELDHFGVSYSPFGNGVAGSITLYAGDIERLLKLLRRQEKRIDAQRQALAVIETWAAFRNGECLAPDDVLKLLEKTREGCE